MPSWPGFYLPHRAPVPALLSWGARGDSRPAGDGAEAVITYRAGSWGAAGVRPQHLV